tara:strand:- start:12124 stop:13074 length:951 start_codon:yes stop_codon:yes gene_type:complete
MKYIITDRRCGLGDAILNLAGSWFVAKKHDMDVIIDWRRLPYTIQDYDSYHRHHINLYNSIFQLPPEIEGVNFHLPEEFPSLYLGPKTEDGHPYDTDHLPVLDQDAKESGNVEAILNSGSFIRTSMRFGQANKYYPQLRRINSFNFNYWSFFNQLPLNSSIKQRFKAATDKYIKPNTVAIHFRHGNGETIMGRGANWVSCEDGVKTIKKESKKFLGKHWDQCDFLIFSDTPLGEKLLLEEFPNSTATPKTLPEEGSGGVHFDASLNPIVSFQDSIIDMLLMTKCNKIMYTQHSTFSLPARMNMPDDNQHMLFQIQK